MRLFSSREERLFYPDYEVEFVIEIHKMLGICIER